MMLCQAAISSYEKQVDRGLLCCTPLVASHSAEAVDVATQFESNADPLVTGTGRG